MSEMDELIFCDLEGNRAEGPDGIVLFALDEREYMERIPAITRILLDPDSHLRERFLACFTLTSWGEAAGYRAVIDAAEDPASEPWVGTSTHRLWGYDDTFAQLAEAVGNGNEICDEKGTAELRTAAVRSLIRLVPRWYFEGYLSRAARPVLGNVLEDLARAVRAGVVRLREGDRPRFDLGSQLASLVAFIGSVDEGLARVLADELLKVDHSWPVREGLARVVSGGAGSPSRGLAWGLVRRGGPVTWFRVAEAFYRRHFGPSWLR